MGYFSNQATIEARISALRLAGFIDRNADGNPDPDALLSGQKTAKGLICGYIGRDYDHDTIDAWDIESETVPLVIGSISDDLCIYVYYWSNPNFRESAQRIYDGAVQQLQAIRDGEMDIYEVERVTAYIDDAIVTGRIASDFDPEREYDDMTVNPNWNEPPDSRELDGY